MIILRLIYLIVLPVLVTGRLWAVLRGRESWGDFAHRMRGPAMPQGAVWIHGASVGEVASARQIIAALRAHPVLVTCNTATGRDSVASWGMAHVTPALAPLDFGGVARRMMAQARALIVLENELWPNRILAAHAAQKPVILLGARMSDRSAAKWSKRNALAMRMLGPVALAVPQDPTSQNNLVGLGVPAEAMQGPIVLKAAYETDTTPLPDDLSAFGPGHTILAASTHAGEEALVLDAFTKALSEQPDLRLIVAPRHPNRAAEIAGLVKASGLTLAQRSRGEAPDALVYLADTLGEMSLWYRRAGVAFLGGSLVDRGGHTPFEPIAYDCPILHGPYVRNFKEIYGALDAEMAAIEVRDAASLSGAMIAHLDDRAMANRARAVAKPVDLAPLIAQITATLGARAAN